MHGSRATAETRERGRVERERRAGAARPDEHAAQRRARRCRSAIGRTNWSSALACASALAAQQVRDERVERRARRTPSRRRRRRRAATTCQSSSPRSIASTASDADGEPARDVRGEHHAPAVQAVADHAADQQEHDRRHRHRDADDRERRRARRRARRPATPAPPGTRRRRAARRTCPLHSSRKSRWRSGARRPTAAEAAGAVEPLVAMVHRPRVRPPRRMASAPQVLERRLGVHRPREAGSPARGRSRGRAACRHCSGSSMPSATTSSCSVVAQRDDRGRRGRRRLGRRAVAQERAVHLEDVDREPAEVAQRRVAGAEVVEREPHAERLELAQALRPRARCRPSAPSR